jgi:UPF0755 protein
VRKLGAIAAALVAAVVLFLAWQWWGPGPAEKPTTVIIPDGSSVGRASELLDNAGAVRGRAWYYFARVLGSRDPIQAGEFEIARGMSGASILDMLQHGKPVQRLITVIEGMPSIIVEEKLAGNKLLTGPLPAIPEGSLLPDSYSYERGETRAAVVKRMQAAMRKTMAALWPKRTRTCPLETPEDAVTLASIVEKETGKASERRTVAGVYCNRLRIGMKLDADPTIIYPITKGKPLGRRIKESEVHSDNPYNTYTHAGLPPGPIANPGKESIAAVLNPAPTKALYFVADGTGGHVFAETLAEQQANVKRWYAIRRQRGEM